jgi:hypothetical protein
MTMTTERLPLNGVNTPTLFATLDAVKAQPDLAASRFRARNRWVKGTHNRSSIHSFYGAGKELEHRHEAVINVDSRDHLPPDIVTSMIKSAFPALNQRFAAFLIIEVAD